MSRQGTPKTLNQAISNAFHAFSESDNNSVGHLRKLLKQHVKDFINNKIGPAYMIASDFEDNEEPDMMKALDRFLKAIK